MNHHIGYASSHLSLSISLRRTVLVSRSVALAQGESIGLSPLVRGRVGATRGYSPCLGRVKATTAPPVIPELWARV